MQESQSSRSSYFVCQDQVMSQTLATVILSGCSGKLSYYTMQHAHCTKCKQVSAHDRQAAYASSATAVHDKQDQNDQ